MKRQLRAAPRTHWDAAVGVVKDDLHIGACDLFCACLVLLRRLRAPGRVKHLLCCLAPGASNAERALLTCSRSSLLDTRRSRMCADRTNFTAAIHVGDQVVRGRA